MGRKITDKMFLKIDTALGHNPLAQEMVARKDARSLLVLAAQTCCDIRERGGNNRGEWVEEIQKTVGRPVGQAWCMDAVQTLVAYVERKLGIKSTLPVSEGCGYVWEHTSPEQKVKAWPAPGAIVIFKHPKGGGHTGVVEVCGPVTFTAFEGNTTGGFDEHAQVVREGGGFYHTKRLRAGTPDMKVVGFIKPF